MKKLIFVLVVMTSCGANTSSVSSSTNSTSSSSFTNSLFDKSIPEGRLLKEDTSSFEFLKETFDSYEGSFFLPQTFRQDEERSVFYEVENAIESNYASQLLTYSTTNHLVSNYLSLFPSSNRIEGDAVAPFLRSILAGDDAYTGKVETSFSRDLSFDVLGEPYYWYNNYLSNSVLASTRYEGITETIVQRDIEFQTGVDIDVSSVTQILSDGVFIYELTDETYPIGFFGANDYKIQTIRTEDNFKEALSVGPIHLMLQSLHQLQKMVERDMAIASLQYDFVLEVELDAFLNQLSFDFSYTSMDSVSNLSETYHLDAVLTEYAFTTYDIIHKVYEVL
jgi:hypothetical protein